MKGYKNVFGQECFKAASLRSFVGVLISSEFNYLFFETEVDLGFPKALIYFLLLFLKW